MSAPFSNWQMAGKWLQYYLTASNGRGHGIHSPFVYQFVRELLMDKSVDPAFAKIEALRSQLEHDRSTLAVQDYGAGSAGNNALQRTVSSLAIHAAKSPRLAQLLFRSVQYFKPASIIELGTSLGISGAYLASAAPNTPVYTLEGAPAIAQKAAANFQSLDLHNISVIPGRFEDNLSAVIAKTGTADLVYLDGNHQYAPTVDYFRFFRDHRKNDTLLIFDDIHWSAGMEKAWAEIRHDPSVTCSIDLFFLGYVFFREENKTPMHFTIRY